MSYAIGEVAAKCGITVPTLRFYEKEGLLPTIERDAAGRRQFSDHDVELVQQIINLKRADASLDEIADFLKLYEAGSTTLTARADFFAQRAAQLQAKVDCLRMTQVYVQYKQWYYDQAEAVGGIDRLTISEHQLACEFSDYLAASGQTEAQDTLGKLLERYPGGLCAVDLETLLVAAN
ncbi:MerR family transcriptional regulator [Lactiplantibacillus mudanjiangensis]|uniref:Transcription regulator, MerR family [Lactobacillus plantarum WCFS1] n=1 Tax=Lactiplantibacillus mudanjiangensis TaxID=1296538 RepID=A0A660DW77_9LACO|nr:MerR family transcriptional regulator [Lactiplantibacillus mudanjiangensis]VDG20015.1 transcription regulator, MerR family [Lactobacillus plantarum WCFS1] [Lactiplantibacillus mudanjiangensis]VDG26175.1 transcription regulator, MerR family [Lactobacillus plantarum WCFS1] [Lactiplantibacillus mudanjiangensis]VDG27328.1 transcription regulator, MerR family [Lactobacillus plantarum WCFS1] [Lactiplantibacillus mudanjiangensis]VDG33409.1 transcription regulator, MerR family [Lactobacillus plantar